MRLPLLGVLLLLPVSLAAQDLADYDYENLRFSGVGLDFGGILPNGMESTLTLGARADLGFLGPRVRIMPGVRFWSSERRERDFGDIRVTVLSLDADAHYVWTDFVGDPYVGAGASLHLMNGSGSQIEGTLVEDLLDTVLPGINVLAGAGLPLGPRLRVFVEARGVLATEVQYAALVVGGILNLPRGNP